jgi:hypothetical protein
VIQIVESESADWEEKPTPRAGRIQYKPLAQGDPGAPHNFEFNLYRFHPGYFTPRHRHNFEQMRLALSGDMTYVKGATLEPGSLVYFPEGAFYGPQETPHVSDVLLLQYGGASGQGYMSQKQLWAARDELSKTGEFTGGVYSWTEENGKQHNQDAVEACYVHTFGKPVEYVKPRIPAPVEMVTGAYHWVDAQEPGMLEKLLGTFTERRVEVRMLKAADATRFVLPRGRRELLFSFAGDMRLGDTKLLKGTSVFCDKDEALELELEDGWEAIEVVLPG